MTDLFQPAQQPEWAYGYGLPSLSASFKSEPGDFVVREVLPFTPEHSGQHAYLLIRKTQLNTQDVVRRLQRLAGVSPRAIGYAGLKDKQAVAEQWFSVDLAKVNEPDWEQLETPEIQVLQATRHRKRLRVGWLQGNQFQLLLRDISDTQAEWEQALSRLQQQPVPNYFGLQRFGHQFGNLAKSLDMLQSSSNGKKRKGKKAFGGKAGFHYSVIRSYVFNQLLSQRVAQQSWQNALPGELLILDGSQSFFQCEQLDSDIEQRLQALDIHPSAPLVGSEQNAKYHIAAAQQWEQQALAPYRDWIEALQQHGLKQSRRALRVKAQALQWQWQDTNLQLSLELPGGSYATSVLRELCELRSAID